MTYDPLTSQEITKTIVKRSQNPIEFLDIIFAIEDQYGDCVMVNTKLKVPAFLKLDEVTKKEILEKVADSDMPEKERLAALESMTFLDNFHKRLKNDPTLTLKKVKKLWELHAERLKKILLTH